MIQDIGEVKRYWRAARMKRGLSIARLAKELSARYGKEITHAQLSNFEYKAERKPGHDLWTVMEAQLREWRREDSLAGETRETYGSTHTCPACQQLVPGPAAGARYCMFCGHSFDCKICPSCGHTEPRSEAQFCLSCGEKL